MAIEQIKETDTLNQGRIKINAILDQSNTAVEKINDYQSQLTEGINDAKKIADDAGKEAVQIAEQAGNQANETANQAFTNSQTAINTSNQAVSTANNNKQEFDALRNDFEKLVGEAGDSNPEIVQARTDTQGVTQSTLATRLQVDFNDRMTKSEGVSLLSGTTNVKVPMDFTGKTAGNTATNANQYFTDVTAKVLKKPKDTWNEVSQSDYNKLVSRDDSGLSSGSTQNGVIPQQLGVFNALEAAKKLIPQNFEGLSQEEAVALLKDSFVAFTISERVKATSPNNKTIKVSTYIESTDSWTTQIQENAGEYKDLSVQVTDKNFITSEGLIYLISYTDPSNGVTTANLDVDYSAIQLEISINAQDVLAKSGFVKEEQLKEHTESQDNPHKVTASQVGLGNVKNYGFATDSEASAGTSTTKYMSPKNVADAIKGQAVTQTGDQEIAGTKDFMNPPKIAGQTVISEKVIAFSAPNTVSVSGTGVKAIPISQKVITNNEFFELSANKIKVLKDGIISVVTSYTTNVPAGWCNIELTKNNAVMNRSNQGTGGLHAAGLTDVFDVKAGDTIAFQSNSNQSSYSVLYLRGFLRYLT
ncbi:hypothetical protein I4L53_001313 [Enterococcus faecalis]|uniref:hypothetical protein n=1 Tax=Enterococcus faecalis TaxID=1351 RepID=UPI000CF24966|nr:hypothetical protein [Enterococcus faecalis]EGS7943340.1 hypothetical protein [Enterococcus faecalis]EHZ5660487.1 hypothetical protein [Enterococcus faecalis]EJZ8637808.1 hypothetical protein [Enterococcus faecalis]PQF15619.1 hypothetical protein CUS86_00475 [Enterococcus faecalis]